MKTRAKTSEQLLIDQCANMRPSGRVLASSLGRAQLAQTIAPMDDVTQVDCLFLDLYRANLALAEAEGENLNILCQPDAPQEQYDLAVMPLGRQGEAELVREQLQEFFDRLLVGGHLWVSVDNPTDKWVRQQLERFDVKITTKRSDQAIAYFCTKLKPLAKRKNYDCEFAFRDKGRLIKAFSRPGVFSHRRIDAGARHLIDSMQIEAGCRVLDIGCGSGTVSVAAALRSDNIHVTSIDSHTRAVQATQETARRNEQDNVAAQLTDSGRIDQEASYDLVVANPPYYADFRVASFFIDTAFRALCSGGHLLVVGKDQQWYEQKLPELFRDVSVQKVKGYVIGSATR